MELKPCPFCGAEPEVLSDMHRTWGLVMHRDGCFFSDFRHHVIPEYDFDAWNTRADYHGFEQAAIDAWRSIKARNTRHVETCRNVSDPPEGFLCSECGWGDFAEPSHLLTGSCYAGLAKGPRYCPNCGRKVEG